MTRYNPANARAELNISFRYALVHVFRLLSHVCLCIVLSSRNFIKRKSAVDHFYVLKIIEQALSMIKLYTLLKVMSIPNLNFINIFSIQLIFQYAVELDFLILKALHKSDRRSIHERNMLLVYLFYFFYLYQPLVLVITRISFITLSRKASLSS